MDLDARVEELRRRIDALVTRTGDGGDQRTYRLARTWRWPHYDEIWRDYPVEGGRREPYGIVFVDGEYDPKPYADLETKDRQPTNPGVARAAAWNIDETYVPRGVLVRVYKIGGQWWFQYRKPVDPCWSWESDWPGVLPQDNLGPAWEEQAGQWAVRVAVPDVGAYCDLHAGEGAILGCRVEHPPSFMFRVTLTTGLSRTQSADVDPDCEARVHLSAGTYLRLFYHESADRTILFSRLELVSDGSIAFAWSGNAGWNVADVVRSASIVACYYAGRLTIGSLAILEIAEPAKTLAFEWIARRPPLVGSDHFTVGLSLLEMWDGRDTCFHCDRCPGCMMGKVAEEYRLDLDAFEPGDDCDASAVNGSYFADFHPGGERCRMQTPGKYVKECDDQDGRPYLVWCELAFHADEVLATVYGGYQDQEPDTVIRFRNPVSSAASNPCESYRGVSPACQSATSGRLKIKDRPRIAITAVKPEGSW
jgi:hypothetical protein